MWQYSKQIRQWIAECCSDCGSGHLSESIRFIWNSRFTARAADAKPFKKLIRLGVVPWRAMSEEQRMETVKHEICHVISYDRYGPNISAHGKEWQTLMIRAGCDPDRLVDIDLSKLATFIKAGCPSCNKEFYISRVKARRIRFYGRKYNCKNCNVPVVLV